MALELANEGQDVMCVSRSGGAGSERIDVTNSAQSRNFLEAKRPVTVIYLARPTISCAVDPAVAVDSDVASLRRFASESREFGVERFIFASSAAVYGTAEETPRCEGDDVSTDSLYSELKFQSETALDEVAESRSLRVLSLRIFNIYGAGFSQSLVNRLVVGDDSVPQVYDTDRFVRDYIHVSDVARAFSSAVSAAGGDSSIMNVGTGVGTSSRKLLTLVPHAIYESIPPLESSSFSVADVSRMHDLWGLEPQVTIESAVQRVESFFH